MLNPPAVQAMLKSTHPGTINLGGGPIECHVLSDGTRVLITQQVQTLIGVANGRYLDRSLTRLSNDDERLAVLPREFISPAGKKAYGYTAEDVTNILRAYQRAFLRDTLHPKQRPMARAAMAAIEAFVAIGLTALIDEATGYQAKRAPDALATEYSRLFGGKKAWEQTFDADWDKTFCRLYGQPYTGRPPFFVKAINSMVYRLAFGEEVYAKLKQENPDPKFGSLHHQFCTEEGKQKLSQAIHTIRGLAKLSRAPKDFRHKIAVVYNEAALQFGLGF